MREKLTTYHINYIESAQLYETRPSELHVDIRYKFQYNNIIRKYGQPNFRNLEECKKKFANCYQEIDALKHDLQNLISNCDQDIDADLIANLKPKVEEIILFKNQYLLKEFFSKLTLQSIDSPEEKITDIFSPVIRSFKDFMSQKTYHWMIDSFELFSNFRFDNRKIFREIYKICFDRICRVIENSKKTERRDLYRFKLCDILDLKQTVLPEPNELANIFDGAIEIKDQDEVVPRVKSKPSRSFNKTKPKKKCSKGFDNRSYNESSSKKIEITDSLNQEIKEPIKFSQVCKGKAPADITTGLASKKPTSQSETKSNELEKEFTNREAIGKCRGCAEFPFRYLNRVRRWFAAQPPLDPKIFEDYAYQSPDIQSQKIADHSFSEFTDFLMNRYHKIEDDKSGIVSYHVAAEMIFKGAKRRGYLLWVARDNVCYHRYFHSKNNSEFIDTLVQKKFQDIDFPPLKNEIALVESQELYSSEMYEEKISISNLLDIVTISNRKKGLILRLFLDSMDK